MQGIAIIVILFVIDDDEEDLEISARIKNASNPSIAERARRVPDISMFTEFEKFDRPFNAKLSRK